MTAARAGGTLAAVLCPRCRRENDASAGFCRACGVPLALRPEAPARPIEITVPLDRREPGATTEAGEPAEPVDPRAPASAVDRREPERTVPPPLPHRVRPPVPPVPARPEPQPAPAPEAARSHWELGPRLETTAPGGPTPHPPGAPAAPVAPRPPAASTHARAPAPRGSAVRAAAPSTAPAAPAVRPPEPARRSVERQGTAGVAGDEPGAEIRLRRAPTSRRAAAWGLDALPLAILAFAVGRLLFDGAAPPAGGIDGVLDFLAREGRVIVPLAAFVTLAAFVYFTLSHALMGATAGKAILRLRVVGGDGRRPTLRRSAARSTAAVLSAALLGLGFLLALFSRSGRALHDWIAGTYVVERP